MSEKKTAARRFAGACVVAIAGLQILAPLSVAAFARERLEVIDRGTKSKWFKSERAWGGGVLFNFPNGGHKSGPADLTPNYVLGCTAVDPAKGYLRFAVELALQGADVSGNEEIAYEKNKAYYFGAPGTVILFDEMDKELERFPLVVTSWGTLETGRLTREEVKSFTDASQIRVETPRVIFDTRAVMYDPIYLSKLPCGPR
ncbi:hypothetical protein MSC49_37590 (plasmid) [Methylosinus sp. C49]|uniref:hypothetical protein n=1 Tax=Methylosinus sp. C49 TaxID=2699395 RepID=UPI001366CE33|nr:hypothetical protein [Methylosinus sp. C49]BBU63824.1 hypothetical protein MSC49_37590 [Methylosinus sp. C49]